MEFSDDFDWVNYDHLFEDIAVLDYITEELLSQYTYGGVHNQEELDQECEKIHPTLEDVCGMNTSPPPKVRFMGKFLAKITNGVSFSLDLNYFSRALGLAIRYLGIAPVRMSLSTLSTPEKENPIHSTLAHELAHSASSNESATMLRGMEINARLGIEGDTNHLIEFYRTLRNLAITTSAMKAIYEQEEEEMLSLAEDVIGSDLKDFLMGTIGKCKKRATHGDHYNSWIYNVLPYKALTIATKHQTDFVEVPQPPSFTMESPVLAGIGVSRSVMNLAYEEPIHMPVALELYRQAALFGV